MSKKYAEQEHKDAVQLQKWRRALRMSTTKGKSTCPDKVRDYLDANMRGWRRQPTEFNLWTFITVVITAIRILSLNPLV